LPGRSDSTAYLGLGGNLGDPARTMGAALRLLDGEPGIRIGAVSSLYRTPPWGKTDQPDFLNAVARIETTLTPRDLLRRCLDVERRLKRERRERWGPRLVDLDILLFDAVDLREPGLDIPHPRLLERAFVLVPLAEIAPALAIGGEGLAVHLARVDAGGIEKLAGGQRWWQDPEA
jgi:2-amino-4-hydroxy-6-hydroxymethyldihydropteridine diphosphokinase